jgi:acyl-CoA dehydrogenase
MSATPHSPAGQAAAAEAPDPAGVAAGEGEPPRSAAQEEVLAAAARAFMDRGFAATSIDDVARLMGATKGRVYHYYRSKLDLFNDVTRRSLERIHAEVAAAEAAGGGARARLERMCRAHVRSILMDQPWHRAALQGVEMHLRRDASPDQRAAVADLIRLRDRHEALFRRDAAAGAQRPGLLVPPPRGGAGGRRGPDHRRDRRVRPRRTDGPTDPIRGRRRFMNRPERIKPELETMSLGMTERLKPLHEAVAAMVRDEIIPASEEFEAEVGKSGDLWTFTDRQTEILEGLKAKARERGLWNFFLTDSERGYGLSTVEYAYLAEEMGKASLGAETFNCSAPDTGNMEVLERYGTEAHKEKWLKPLLNGEIRSAYLMTEPNVASSDATNISMKCERDGDHYVLNGEKWWSSGAGDPRCKVYITMVKTPDASRPKHQQHSQILVDPDTPGITKLRAMQVFGDPDAPHGHLHLKFENVRVPAENLLLGEGRGFEISQGRLGPGRIHHCMRAIGQAERALELMIRRSMDREAFGEPLYKLGANYDIIAEARMEIEQARLLCLKAAWMMDQGDPRQAGPWISMIKTVAPRMACKVIDEAIQMHGGAGVSQETPLAHMYTHVRTLRLADGPDAVHRRQIARRELRQYTQEKV